MNYFERILTAYHAQTGPTDARLNGFQITFDINDDVQVHAAIISGAWQAVRESGSDLQPLEFGPLVSAGDASVVEWLRRIVNAEPDHSTRTYVVGLPVVITVGPDGTVTVEVDLSEASDLTDSSVAYGEGQEEHPDFESHLETDIRRIDNAIADGRIRWEA